MNFKIVPKPVHKATFVESLMSPFFALIATIIVTSILLLSLNYSPLTTYYSFFVEPLSSGYSFAEVIMKATILAIIALGLALGFRANVWNIGAEGQFIIGAILGSIIALNYPQLPSGVLIPLMVISGAIGGMAWAAIPAFLKNWFNTNEILTSLMLVYIAELLLTFSVYGPLKDPDGLNFPQSVYFSDSAIYPVLIEGTRFSITFIFLLIIFPIVYLFMKKAYLGFQLKVVGLSPPAAKYGGFSSKNMVWLSFLACGALAGIAGISEVSANISQLIPKISPGYGFSAIIVAYLGRLSPVGILFAAMIMALTYIGAESAQVTMGLPVSMGGIFQGLILFFLLGADFFVNYRIVRS